MWYLLPYVFSAVVEYCFKAVSLRITVDNLDTAKFWFPGGVVWERSLLPSVAFKNASGIT